MSENTVEIDLSSFSKDVLIEIILRSHTDKCTIDNTISNMLKEIIAAKETAANCAIKDTWDSTE